MIYLRELAQCCLFLKLLNDCIGIQQSSQPNFIAFPYQRFLHISIEQDEIGQERMLEDMGKVGFYKI